MVDPVVYVVGFLFNADRSRVVLMRKRRPTWQAGLLNGPGGHVNEGERMIEAMVREFTEETGVTVPAEKWIHVAEVTFPAGVVGFFYAVDEEAFHNVATVTDETIIQAYVNNLPLYRCVRNLNYLIPLCLHWDAAASGSRVSLPVYINEETAP